ncbi:MAG: DUF1667 domain-containing protein [Lentisphaerae bacterium]|nr:DUF1667 domain-containing protein [Lentisphaerota bacterium]
MPELICISCPQGCHLTAVEANGSVTVSGNRCPRGEVYAKQELTDPRRMVTAVMPSDNKKHPFIAVRTTAPYPKAKIPALLNRLYAMTIKTPVKNGDIIIADIDNSGIGVIVTENI